MLVSWSIGEYSIVLNNLFDTTTFIKLSASDTVALHKAKAEVEHAMEYKRSESYRGRDSGVGTVTTAALVTAAHSRDVAAMQRRVGRSDAPMIVYDNFGTGSDALLFMPGWCVSRKVFQSLPGLCARGQRVLALDWRGHGESGPVHGDFGEEQLVQDALDVMRDAGVKRVVPVALAHAGWIALELRRRLGNAVAGIVLVDWLISDPPPPFLQALHRLQRADEWQAARAELFSMWTHDTGHPELERFIAADMGAYDFAMWSRAGREIANAYETYRSPMTAMAALKSCVPAVHIYAQPDGRGFLAAQQAYASDNPWFQVEKLAARSHFPMFEVPQDMARIIGDFSTRNLR